MISMNHKKDISTTERCLVTTEQPQNVKGPNLQHTAAAETKKALFSWELAVAQLPYESSKILRIRSHAHIYLAYLLILAAVVGFILSIIIIILPHQVSGLKRTVFGLRLEVFYSIAIFIVILSCLILWSVNHALKKISFPWVVVGSGFTLIIAGMGAYVLNIHSINAFILNFSIIILIILESIFGAITLILTLSSRYIFESELRL